MLGRAMGPESVLYFEIGLGDLKWPSGNLGRSMPTVLLTGAIVAGPLLFWRVPGGWIVIGPRSALCCLVHPIGPLTVQTMVRGL